MLFGVGESSRHVYGITLSRFETLLTYDSDGFQTATHPIEWHRSSCDSILTRTACSPGPTCTATTKVRDDGRRRGGARERWSDAMAGSGNCNELGPRRPPQLSWLGHVPLLDHVQQHCEQERRSTAPGNGRACVRDRLSVLSALIF